MTAALSTFGKHFIVGLASTTLEAEERLLLSRLRPLGVILFAHNVERSAPDWQKKIRSLVANAKDASGRENFLVSIDHEGGRVHRLVPPVTRFPAAWQWEADAECVGRAMGQELASLGINLNFAPVLDIFSEPQNEVIGKRSLSDCPTEVATWGSDFIRGQESAGVLACGKHFPGHGATIKDSHFELPTLDIPRETLDSRELIPFRASIACGLQLMMTAHVMYPQIDAVYPATLSRTILQGILREELGFGGCVISDALEMKALSGFRDDQIAARAIEAGVDLLLVAKPEMTPPLRRAIQLAQSLQQLPVNLAPSAERVERLMSYVRELQRRPTVAEVLDRRALTDVERRTQERGHNA